MNILEYLILSSSASFVLLYNAANNTPAKKLETRLPVQSESNSQQKEFLLEYIVITETPVPTRTPTPTLTPTVTPTIVVWAGNLNPLMEKYASQHSVSRDLLAKIALCESNLNPAAVNGPYGGLYQFSSSAWVNARSRMNKNTDPALRFNAEEAIDTAAFQIARGGAGIWPNCIK